MAEKEGSQHSHSPHDPETTLIDLAEKLAARRRHVIFLLGAGTGCSAGLPDLAGLAKVVGERLNGEDRAHYERLATTRNIEEVLTHLRLLVALTGGTEERLEGLSAKKAEHLDRRICSAIASVILETEASLDHHERFGTWIARTPYDTPVEIFTTNYDLLLEAGLERAGAAYFDGFVGIYEGRFRSDLVDPPASTAAAGLALPSTWARLWKLHGSVSWVQDEAGAMIRLGAGAHHDPERALVIYHLLRNTPNPGGCLS